VIGMKRKLYIGAPGVLLLGGAMLWLWFVLHATRIWSVLWPNGDAQHGKTISDQFGRAA
jgi:hypothetical protein